MLGIADRIRLAGRARKVAMLLLLAMVGLAGIAVPAAAQRPSQDQINAIRQNCRSDYRTYCANVPTGGSAALACLQQNAANLSPPCRQAVGAASGGAQAPAPQRSAGAGTAPAQPQMRMEMAELRQHCNHDYLAYCRGVGFGGGRALGCLADNRESLSPDCRNALMTLRQGR